MTDVYAPAIGGIERQVETLVRRQRAQGHDVVVLTAGPDSALEVPGVRRRGWTQVAFRPDLPGDLRPDVVHGHLSVLSPLTLRATAAAARRQLPVALTVHSLWPGRPASMRALLAAFGGIPAPVTWSAVSEAAAGRLRSVLAGRPEVTVVPNEVDTGWWTRPGAAIGSADEVHVVLVNRLAGRKRVVPFIRMLGRDLPAVVRVTIVGDGPRRADVAAAIERRGLSRRVRLVGALAPEGVRELLHSADLFAAPARLESFGIAALEARAAGVPVLGFAGTGLADVVTDGRDARLVSSDKEFRLVLRELVADRRALAALQRHARTVAPRVDAAKAAAAVGALYASAMGERPGAGRHVGAEVLGSR